ncbi:hypothetical protein FIBSPDRAFT_872315 [Athelia psychrophila]|uniref:Uncharacterized protein n=1 Tax=Athelia psychrophila TaxID=1759441 RepID=A0A165ZNX1_9AGAM|nr:hypothetical protein FIBSPDRAFT_872315 [Fibularhizoctonia sp. CBS 109695]
MGLGAAQMAALTLTIPSLGPGRSSPSSSSTPPRFVCVLFGACAESARIRLAREHLKRHQRCPVPTSIPRLLPPQRRIERGGVLPHIRLGIRLGYRTQRNSRTGHARAASISLALHRLPATAPAGRTRPPLCGARPFLILSPITSLGIATMGDMGANMGMGSVIANMEARRAVP